MSYKIKIEIREIDNRIIAESILEEIIEDMLEKKYGFPVLSTIVNDK